MKRENWTGKSWLGLCFKIQEKLEQLNAIVHPAVREYILCDMKAKHQEDVKLYVLEAALLLEAGYAEICEEIWFIYTEEVIRRARLKTSRGYSDKRITDMIRSQSPESYFKENCTRVIDNSSSIEETRRQIGEILL